MSEILFFDFNLTLGTKVRIARIARHLTQNDLAEDAGVTQTDVSAIERDATVYPLAEWRILEHLKLLGDGITHYKALIRIAEGNPALQRFYSKRLEHLESGAEEAFTT